MRCIQLFLVFVGVVLTGLLLASPRDPCASDLSALHDGPLDEAALAEYLHQLSRFALDEVQKAGQPSSAQAGLREDLQGKLRELARRSGHSLAEIEKQLLKMKTQLVFAGRSLSRESDRGGSLRTEFDQLPESYSIRHVLKLHTDTVHTVAFSPDGQRLASGSLDMTVRVWEPRAGKPIHRLPSVGDILSVVFTPDGTKLFAGGRGDDIQSWNPVDGSRLEDLSVGDTVRGLAVSPDGAVLAAAVMDRQNLFWEIRNRNLGDPPPKKQVLNTNPLSNYATSAAFSSEGKLAVAYERFVYVWDRIVPRNGSVGGLQPTPQILVLENTHELGGISSLAFSRDGKLLACGMDDGSLGLWDITRDAPAETWRGAPKVPGGRSVVAFSPDGKRLLSGGNDGRANLWNVEDRKLFRSLYSPSGAVNAVTFSPDGEQIAVASDVVTIWGRDRVDDR